ncbi:histidine phosphatase family protein [Haloquadratum walsbyi]|uniref:Fructose-2,6-bisphosphatase n=1 Tax=Haloquadratum walsbyi J07HQW2 TaxID=1238425 RepID=U1MZ88_9EURY|nr:histidine phosphatase family protein [Haloquadratum walsbyi]ERG95834.1 MAG: fructose-2,6-bisphosphatase [Haloquadratum walsbyi J07HQW2]
MVEKVFAVRHGQRQDSVDPDWETHADRLHDPGLTDLGRWAAWRVGRRFAEMNISIDAVYSSPFLRAVETASEICAEISASFAVEPGLGEHRNPEWFDAEPQTIALDRLDIQFERLHQEHVHVPKIKPNYPESSTEAMDRIGETTRQLVESTSGALVLVGHGATIGGVVDGLIGTTEDVDAPLCGISRLDCNQSDTVSSTETKINGNNNWQLKYSGDTAHLDV